MLFIGLMIDNQFLIVLFYFLLPIYQLQMQFPKNQPLLSLIPSKQHLTHNLMKIAVNKHQQSILPIHKLSARFVSRNQRRENRLHCKAKNNLCVFMIILYSLRFRITYLYSFFLFVYTPIHPSAVTVSALMLKFVHQLLL